METISIFRKIISLLTVGTLNSCNTSVVTYLWNYEATQEPELPRYVMQEGEQLRSGKMRHSDNVQIIQVKTALLNC